MPFDRDRLPDPVSYYEGQGLIFREPKGKWRTTRCEFHGGSDSLRINTETGAFVCMAGCGARGGDLLAYHMATYGLEFIDAAKDLDAWVNSPDDKVIKRRPAPFTPRDGLAVLRNEATLVAVAAGNLAHGITLADGDRQRLLVAANRINLVMGVAA